jgi:hypothetical protein
VHRPLVLLAVASPFVVGCLAVVLVAHALANSWLWGSVGAVLAVAMLGVVMAAIVWWSQAHPDAWEALTRSVARARSGYPVEQPPFVRRATRIRTTGRGEATEASAGPVFRNGH